MSVGRRRLRRSVVWGVVVIVALSGGALAFATRHSGSGASFGGPLDPPCAPEHVNVSDVLPGTSLAVSPLPGSYDAMPQTQISMLGARPREISGVSVTGSQTGPHPGRLIAYSQGDGASFVPEKPFQSGEIVTVEGTLSTIGGSKRFSFHFGVAYPDPIALPTAGPSATPPAGSVQSFHSAPELSPPSVQVITDSPEAEEGDIFLAPYSGPGRNGPTILNQQGQLVWMDALPGVMKATNLQVEQYQGNPVLTWWQGYIPKQGFGLGEEVVANTSYEPIMHIKAGNGDQADLHDFHLEPHDTAVLTVFQTIHCDLSAAGGPRDAALTDASYQEIDLKTGLVRRMWSSVDHVPLSLSVAKDENSSDEWPFDFFHLNTIDPRGNGTTLISSRNTSALYILDTKTGQVLTRIGGKSSEVKMEPGTETAYQHDAMTLPNGDISVFDNGGAPFASTSTPFGQTESQGLIVEVNTQAKTDRLILALKHSPPLHAGSQGDVQPMADGSWFVGWGQEPYFSEYSSTGRLLYDAKMWAIPKQLETESYRTYKFPWHATPYWPPSIAASRGGEAMEVWASWNGATEVTSWRVLGGSSPGTLTPLASGARTNFETTFKARYEPYVEVQAVNAQGTVIGNSPIIKPAG